MLPILAVMCGRLVYTDWLMKNGVEVFVDMPKDADRKELIAKSGNKIYALHLVSECCETNSTGVYIALCLFFIRAISRMKLLQMLEMHLK